MHTYLSYSFLSTVLQLLCHRFSLARFGAHYLHIQSVSVDLQNLHEAFLTCIFQAETLHTCVSCMSQHICNVVEGSTHFTVWVPSIACTRAVWAKPFGGCEYLQYGYGPWRARGHGTCSTHYPIRNLACFLWTCIDACLGCISKLHNQYYFRFC